MYIRSGVINCVFVAVGSILVMCPPCCIVSSFRIPVVRIWLVRNGVLLVLGAGIALMLVLRTPS